jgi:hypothetical protein
VSVTVRDAELDVATLLGAAGLGLSLGTNLFAGLTPEDPAVPDTAVVVRGTGGPPPEPYVSGGSSVRLRPTVQVVVRGAREAQNSARGLAFQVFGALVMAMPAGYASCLPREAAPAYMGPDAAERPRYAFNLDLEYVAG